MTIQLAKPFVCQQAKDNVMRVLESGWLGMGPEVEEFEKEFAAYIGCKHAIAMNSGTEALRIALHVNRPYTRSIVLTTPNTFVATNHVILQEGLIPYFIDIDPNTGSMDLNLLEAHLSRHEGDVAAVMFVHYGGAPLYMDRLRSLIKRYGVYLIEDAAHCAGASYNGEKVGKDSVMACFSFHAVKPLATGDGGMIVTSDALLANKARKLRWFGIDKSTAERSKAGYSWEYNVEMIGFKSHMNDITATIGRGQLTKLDEQIAKREHIYQLYKKNLKGSSIELLTQEPATKSSHYLMVVRLPDAIHKRAAMARLEKEDIQYGYHYKANYEYRPYARYKGRQEYPGMEEFQRTALSLPMHIFLRDCDVDQICNVIKGAL